MDLVVPLMPLRLLDPSDAMCTAVYRTPSALSDEEITAIHEAASNARASARATLRRSAKGGGEHTQTWLQASCVEEFLTPAFHSCIRKLITIMYEADRASGWGLLSSEGDLRGGDVQQSSIRQTPTSGGGLTLTLTRMLTPTPTRTLTPTHLALILTPTRTLNRTTANDHRSMHPQTPPPQVHRVSRDRGIRRPFKRWRRHGRLLGGSLRPRVARHSRCHAIRAWGV